MTFREIKWFSGVPMLGWWSLKSHLTAPLLLCDLFMDCLLRNESLRGIFPLEITWHNGKCMECAVKQMWVPFMPLILPRCLSGSWFSWVLVAPQKKMQLTRALLPSVCRIWNATQSQDELDQSELFLSLSFSLPNLCFVQAVSHWWGLLMASTRGKAAPWASEREGFSLVCEHHRWKRKEQKKGRQAFQAGMQELEEGFVGDKSKKIV